MQKGRDFIIFTDGACSGNPGPGGWAFVLIIDRKKVIECAEGVFSTTNNRMEMTALLQALKEVPGDAQSVRVLTDSVYVIRGTSEWSYGWKRRGWKNFEGEPVANQDLWEQIVAEKARLPKIEFGYVRGHTGVPGNERCDELAVDVTKDVAQGETSSRWYELQLGELSYDPLKIPTDTSLPEVKFGQTEKKKAHSYLSLLDGKVQRHATWSECEARVKGRSGAKFKRANTAEEEVQILATWGYSLTDIN